jgi:tetratricopeptide (TPR) repeat protein
MGWEDISKAGAQAFQNGDYGEAERQFAGAVSEAKQLGPDDPRLAHAMNDLAMFYHALGRLTEAEPLYRRAISIDEVSGLAASPDFVVTLENIAELYRTQQRMTEAAAMYRRAAAMSESLYRAAHATAGDNHPDLIPHLASLASLSEAQDDLEEAERHYRRILSIREAVMEPGSIEIAGSSGRLAYILTLRGTFEEAEDLYMRARAIEEAALGPGHPDVATTLVGLRETAAAIKTLASQFVTQKRYAEAEPLHKRLLEIGEAMLGGDHPHLVTELIDLAGLYCDREQYEKAEPLLRRAMKIAVKNSNTADLSAVHLMELYAWLLDKLGRSSDATEISARAAALRAKVA